MKKLLYILIVTASISNWYFGYVAGLHCVQCANAAPPESRSIEKPKAKPAKPQWRELDGDSLLPEPNEYADKSLEQLDGLLLFGNQDVKLNLTRRK
jgi:hypothetical protein